MLILYYSLYIIDTTKQGLKKRDSNLLPLLRIIWITFVYTSGLFTLGGGEGGEERGGGRREGRNDVLTIMSTLDFNGM